MEKLLSAVALAAAMMTPVAASATLIDFDVDGTGKPISPGTAITDQYANLGVLFAGIENGGSIPIVATTDLDGGVVPSSPNALSNCAVGTALCPANRADVIRITFAASVSEISLLLNTLGSEAVTFNLYNAAGTLLETKSLTSGSGYSPLSFASSGVSRIDGLQPNDNWGWAMDNLSFTSTSAVPEPASWAMMILGFGAIGYAMRRKTVLRFV